MGQDSSVSESQYLADGANVMGFALNRTAIPSLLAYLDLLYSWNSYAGLTAIPRRDAVRLHLLDSLSLAPSLCAARTIVDLGSGGGLPGIPLALAMSATTVTLVESKRRRCSFLREAVRQLELAQRVKVIEADARAGVASQTGPQDAVVARAFASPSDVLAMACPFLSSGGLVALMAGGGGVGDLALVDRAHGLIQESTRTFRLPGGNEERSVTTFRKRRTDCFT